MSNRLPQIELYHDPKNNVLVYRGPGCEKLAARVPGTKLVRDYVVVPDSLYARQMARWVDLPAPPPLDGYDYPRACDLAPTPTAAQKAMANFAALHPKCFNLSDMGTMKTLATLWAADFVMQQFPPGECRALVVCPLSIVQRVWGDAIFNHFLGRRSFQILHGSSATAREKNLAKPADFYIVNFDGLGIGSKTKPRLVLGGLSKQLYERKDIRIAIIDEASHYRDRRTRRHKFARLLAATRDYLWLLTATPTSNGPADAYGLAKLVNDCYGESFASFHGRTMVQLGKWKFRPARGGYLEAGRLLQPAIRIDIKDVWDGPPCTIQTRDVELTAEQHAVLSEIKKEKVLEFKGRLPEVLPNEAVVRLKALQACMGALYDKDHNVHKLDCRHRITELKDCIREANRKILIFVPLTSILDLLYSELQGTEEQVDAGTHWNCIRINGAVSRTERDSAVSAFRDDDSVRIALCDPSAVAYGFNEFIAATTVVWFGPTDKPELYIQGNKRSHRPGQRFPVTIVHLAASALERGIFNRLAKNESLQGLMLSWIKDDKI